MTEMRVDCEVEEENETFPVEPTYRPVHQIPRRIFGLLASVKLAMSLLVAILSCCLAGVTLWRGAEAGARIFGTLWFNGLLVLLVVNIACCFFGRIWRRKLTLITFGMILFHLSFISMLVGVVYNSLYYFRGNMRLTEGETLPNGDLQSYDSEDHGRFFRFDRLKGETTLVKMHTGYRVDGRDKRAAYEVVVGQGDERRRGVIYLTNNLDFHGVKYLPDREGYSLRVDLYDRKGSLAYGAIIPLQSLKQKSGEYLYTTGTKDGAENIPFPQGQTGPFLGLLASYTPSKLKERGGDVSFKVWKLKHDGTPEEQPSSVGKVAVGAKFAAGDYSLSAQEVRYWVGMNVRHEPGQPIVLASLWVCLSGMVLTFFGRMRKGMPRQ